MASSFFERDDTAKAGCAAHALVDAAILLSRERRAAADC